MEEELCLIDAILSIWIMRPNDDDDDGVDDDDGSDDGDMSLKVTRCQRILKNDARNMSCFTRSLTVLIN